MRVDKSPEEDSEDGKDGDDEKRGAIVAAAGETRIIDDGDDVLTRYEEIHFYENRSIWSNLQDATINSRVLNLNSEFDSSSLITGLPPPSIYERIHS